MFEAARGAGLTSLREECLTLAAQGRRRSKKCCA